MKIPLNPRIALHTAKVDLGHLCLSPIVYKYLTILNQKSAKAKVSTKHKSTTVENLLKGCKREQMTGEDLVKLFVAIPHRNCNQVNEIIPSLHLSFSLLWTQLALLADNKKEKKQLYHVVANVPDKLRDKAIEASRKKTLKTTIIKELLRDAMKKMPADIKLWAVLEVGKRQKQMHIHIVVALDEPLKQLLKDSLNRFNYVPFKNTTQIAGENIPIDIGAAYYLAKTLNVRHSGSNNLYVSPALNKQKRALESKYRDFIAENKPFLLNNKKAIQRSLQAHEQQRKDATPKTYEEWENKNLNQHTEELDTTVFWQEVES